MSIRAGLVGLPNVGKSTLFNALTESSVPAENYPFCTIDPHNACTTVPDARIESLQKIYQSEKLVPAVIQFVDIAGLVKGAASGEGLGNQFLSHIREVNLILHILRCFEDPHITHIADMVNPLEDFTIIMQELMLKDLEVVHKRKDKVSHLIKKNRQNIKELTVYEAEYELLEALEGALNADNIDDVRRLAAHKNLAELSLLSAKNFLVIANVSERDIEHEAYKNNAHYQALCAYFGSEKVIPVAARLEAELSALHQKDQAEMMTMLGLAQRGLDVIIERTYQELGLITFFTCGPQEIHAWPLPRGTTIRRAAGEIHSDLERGFIAAEVFNYQDLMLYGSPVKLREAGKIRTEGQEYVVKDGDIILVRFNV